MQEKNSFYWKYFVQTRQEIDNEKKERDQILNFAVVGIVTAIGLVASRLTNSSSATFTASPLYLLLEGALLFIISSFMWIRYKKLKQISERWFVLKHYFEYQLGLDMPLEKFVCDDLTSNRYLKKDFVLNIALCSPIYGLMVYQLFSLPLQNTTIFIICNTLLLFLHVSLSWGILSRHFPDPYSNKKSIKTPWWIWIPFGSLVYMLRREEPASSCT